MKKHVEMAGDTILITGGNGFLGQHVIKHLQERANNVTEIRVLDVQAFTKKLEYEAKKPVISIVGSITDEEALRKAMKGVDCVMHLAGVVSVRTLAETERMEEVNVKGTHMVIQACIEQNVRKLIFSSTMNVAIGYQDIIDGTEDSVTYPEKFLFESYAETKCAGEKAVLRANGEIGSNGNTLRTLSLRPVAMYGELDPHCVTSIITSTSKFGGILLPLATKTSYFQVAYVGNVSWGFVCAYNALCDDNRLGGEAFFVTDDTPLHDLFHFSKPYVEAAGFKLLSFTPPYLLLYIVFMILEFLAWILSPLCRFELPCSFSSVISFNMRVNFSYSKANKFLSYSPLYNPEASQNRSLSFYKNILSNKHCVANGNS
ncbi:hypothetical protein KUTeg_010220, partial [Tegillarca granosa]